MRNLFVLGLVVLILLSWWKLYTGIRARPIPDTFVRVRDGDRSVAVYPGVQFGPPIYWLAPGARVGLGDVRRATGKGTRYAVFLPIEDGLYVVGFVDPAELVAADVDAVRARLDLEGGRF